MQTLVTIQNENNFLNFKYDEINHVQFDYWNKLYNNVPVSFNIKDNIMLISDSMNVTFKDNDMILTIPLEDCQKLFQRYYNNLSNSNLLELLKNSFC